MAIGDDDPFAPPMPGVPRPQEAPGWSPWPWTRAHPLLAAIVVGCLAACLFILSPTMRDFDLGEVNVDTASLRDVEDRLQPALVDFGALVPPDGTRPANDAEFSGCGAQDSGEAFQPSVDREWLLLDRRGNSGTSVLVAARTAQAAPSRTGWSSEGGGS